MKILCLCALLVPIILSRSTKGPDPKALELGLELLHKYFEHARNKDYSIYAPDFVGSLYVVKSKSLEFVKHVSQEVLFEVFPKVNEEVLRNSTDQALTNPHIPLLLLSNYVNNERQFAWIFNITDKINPQLKEFRLIKNLDRIYKVDQPLF